MNYDQSLLHKIADYNHQTYFGNTVNTELVQVFQLKNLFLYSFKLLQKYETLTISTCSQINKSVLIRNMKRFDESINKIQYEMEFWRQKIAKVNGINEILRMKLKESDFYKLPSGLDKLYPICPNRINLEEDLFINCDDVFIGPDHESVMSDSQTITLIPQRSVGDYYKQFMFIQLHFQLLLAQGCNYALPLLTTRLSFINRIVYWPHPPVYGFVTKTSKLRKKLAVVKLSLIECIDELINAINEVEKWSLFYRKSQDFCQRFMQEICNRRLKALSEFHDVRMEFLSAKLEHSRLIGALLKIDPNFFKNNLGLLNIETATSTTSTTTDIDLETITGNSKSSSSISNNLPWEKPFPKSKYTTSEFDSYMEHKSSKSKLKKEAKRSHDSSRTISQRSTSKSISSGSNKKQSKQNSKKPNTKTSKKPPKMDTKEVGFAKKILKDVRKSSRESKESISIPSRGKSQMRITNVSTTPDEALFCHCVTNVPPVDEIRQLLFSEKEPGTTNEFCPIGTVVKDPKTNRKLSKEFNQSSIISIPKTGKSKRRLNTVSTAPDEALFCQCVDNVPAVDEIRTLILPGNQPIKTFWDMKTTNSNTNNNIFWSTLKKMNKSTTLDNYQWVFAEIERLPEFFKIKRNFNSNKNLLTRLSNSNNSNDDDDDAALTKMNVEQVQTESNLVLNILSPTSDINRQFAYDKSNILSSENTKSFNYKNLLNNYLSTRGFQLPSNTNDDGMTKAGESDQSSMCNVISDIINSLAVESNRLTQSFSSIAANNIVLGSTSYSNSEYKLKESLKLYAKYLN